MSAQRKDQWTGKMGVIFAVAGSAVGLGNFLRFPGLAAQYGGGAFMVAYFVSLLLIGVPVAWAEWSLGRKGGNMGSNCGPGIFWKLTKGSNWWKFLGIAAVLGPTCVGFYYVVVEAWCFSYIWSMITSMDSFATSEGTQAFFERFTGMGRDGSAFTEGRGMLIALGLSLVLNLVIVYKGITRGIETFCRWVVPVLIVISIVLLVKVLMLGTPDPAYPERSVAQGLGYMWNPDKVLVEEWSATDGWKETGMVPAGDSEAMARHQAVADASDGRVRLREVTLLQGLMNAQLWIAAAGQVFLSLSVGVGLVLTYSSYLKKKDDIALSALTAIGVNETCEVSIAGMMTVPAAVAFFGIAGAAGQGTFALGFNTLPQVFARMGGGQVFGSLFFLLLFLAAVTSSISLMQAGLAFFEEFMGLGRKLAVVILGFFTCVGSLLVAWYSKGLLALDTFDFFMGTLCFYVSAMLIMILFSWKLDIRAGIAEINETSEISIPRVYRFIMKYVTPTVLVGLLAAWLAENIWVKRSSAIQAVLNGERGAVVPVIALAAYFLFLVFVTMASPRHHVWRPGKRGPFPSFEGAGEDNKS